MNKLIPHSLGVNKNKRFWIHNCMVVCYIGVNK